MQVDKTQFKIGSLDLLMQLNEHAARIDAQVEKAAIRFEKIAMDNGCNSLVYTDEEAKRESKPRSLLCSSQ